MRTGRRLIIALGIVALAAVAVLTLRGPRPRARPFGHSGQIDLRQYEIRELSGLGFLKPGAALLLGRYRPVMPPVHALFLRYRGDIRGVTHPNDLSGYVTIHSEGEALAYVRLFSSLVIPTSMPQTDWDEVLHIGALSPGLFFGVDAFWDRTPADVRYWDELGRPYQRPFGIILDEEWSANGISEPAVKRAGQGFAVTRWLWTLDTQKGARNYGTHRGTDTAYLVAHTVSPDGTVTEKILAKRKVSGIVLVELGRRL